MSLRYWLYTGCPSTCPSTVTQIVDPSVGITYGCWVSAQPKLITVPDTVAPCPGVSMVPNGLVACALSTVMVRVPKSTATPALLRAMACNFVSAIARAGRAAVVGQPVGQHQVAPAGSVIERSIGIGGLHIRTCAGHEHRIADVH